MFAKPDEDKTLSGNDLYEGFCADLASLLAKKLEFDYVLKPVRDKKYGARMPNGSWNGMVGELIRKVLYTVSCFACICRIILYFLTQLDELFI